MGRPGAEFEVEIVLPVMIGRVHGFSSSGSERWRNGARSQVGAALARVPRPQQRAAAGRPEWRMNRQAAMLPT
jgi:hypothetical protein